MREGLAGGIQVRELIDLGLVSFCACSFKFWVNSGRNENKCPLHREREAGGVSEEKT